MAADPPLEPTEYDLKVDTQVEKFVENKQKLTYFLVTASIAVVAFLVNFAVQHESDVEEILTLLIVSSVAGLLTAGFSLLNLHLELRSYNLHLKYRYQRKTWESLKPDDQAYWDKTNKRAAFFLKGAFVLLFLEIAFAVGFFIVFFF